MAVRLQQSLNQWIKTTAASGTKLDELVQAAIAAQKDIAIMCHLRADVISTANYRNKAFLSIGKSTAGAEYRSISAFTSGQGYAVINDVFGAPSILLTTNYAAGSSGGAILVSDYDGNQNTFQFLADSGSNTTSGAWPDTVDRLSCGWYAGSDTITASGAYGGAVEHIAVVALASGGFTSEIRNQITGNGGRALPPREVFNDADILMYFPLQENLKSEIVGGAEDDTYEMEMGSSTGFFYDDWGISNKQTTNETLTASDLSGAFLGNTRPSSIRALRTAKKKTVYDGPTAAGTTVANGWRSTKDVLIRGIQPDSDGIQSAEGVGGEHVRPWAISAAGVQLGVGSSSARAYTRAQGASSWDRTDDTTQWSGLWTFPDSENVIGYSSGFYVTSVADIIAGTAPTAATSDVELVKQTTTAQATVSTVTITDSTNSPFEEWMVGETIYANSSTGGTWVSNGNSYTVASYISSTQITVNTDASADNNRLFRVIPTITNPATGSGTVNINEAVSLASVGTGPSGIACFAAYSNPATDHVRKIWATDDGGANWTEVFDADDSAWDDDWEAAFSGFTPGNKKLRPKHFHGPVWLATENKWLCPYGDGYAQTGAVVCGPDPSAPATDVLQAWQLRSSQPFGPSVFKGKILGGCDRNEGHGYHEYDGTFVPLEKQLPYTDQARHSFHTFTAGQYGYFAPHPEDANSKGVSSVPLMVIKDYSGLVQVPYWISRNETGAAGILQMDNNAGINNGALALELGAGAFQHFKLTEPKLRTAKGFAVLPARANLWEGSMDGASGGPGIANWSVSGDYTSLTNVNDPDGDALALKGTIPSGTQDAISTIVMSRSNLEVVPNITKPGLGFSAYVTADIPLDCTLGFGINSVITSSSLSSIDAALVWKRLRNASLLWDTLNTWIINLFVAANVSNSDGYGEMRNTALAGELQIANIMLGRAPIIDVHVEAVDAKAGYEYYAAQQATYYEYDITTDAEWGYLFHVEPLNSAWEYRGHQNNNRHTIAEFELANGRKVALEALPVAYTTIDTESSGTLTLDDSVATADMEGNVVWTTTDSAAAGETNYIDTYTSGTSIDVTAGSYVAPTAGDHCWIEALSLYVVEYDASGSEVTSERLGRFNVQYGVAIPVGIGFTSAGKAVGYHAAEGKGVIGSGITLNGSADFTETTVTIRHGNNQNVERIMPHYCTVVDYYGESMDSKAEFAAKFNAAAVESSLKGLTLLGGGNALISRSTRLGGSALVS